MVSTDATKEARKFSKERASCFQRTLSALCYAKMTLKILISFSAETSCKIEVQY